MRLSFYRFPDNSKEEDRLAAGCEIFLKNGGTVHADTIPIEHRDEVDSVGFITGPWNINVIKSYMKKFGGSGYTEHYERDGSLFEVTEIELKGNNSKFKYSRHL